MRRRGVIAALTAFTAAWTRGQTFSGVSGPLRFEMHLAANDTLTISVDDRKVVLTGKEIIETLQPPFEGAI